MLSSVPLLMALHPTSQAPCFCAACSGLPWPAERVLQPFAALAWCQASCLSDTHMHVHPLLLQECGVISTKKMHAMRRHSANLMDALGCVFCCMCKCSYAGRVCGTHRSGWTTRDNDAAMHTRICAHACMHAHCASMPRCTPPPTHTCPSHAGHRTHETKHKSRIAQCRTDLDTSPRRLPTPFPVSLQTAHGPSSLPAFAAPLPLPRAPVLDLRVQA